MTNVSGLMCKIPDMCFCTNKRCLYIAESLPLLCANTTIDIVSESVRQHEMQSKGSHLLRNITQSSLLSPELYCSTSTSSSRSFLVPMSTAFGCYDSVAASNGATMPLPPGVKCVQMQQQHEKKPPSNLL